LKTTNLIFLEHQKYSQIVPLLKEENANLLQINNSWERTDSIRKVQLVNYAYTLEDKDKSIAGLKKSLKRQKVIFGSTLIGLVICLLMK
jgi:hypothetical protein